MGGRFKVRHLAVLIDRDDETDAVDEIAVAPGTAIPGGAGADQVVGSAFFKDDEIPLPQLRCPFCARSPKGRTQNSRSCGHDEGKFHIITCLKHSERAK